MTSAAVIGAGFGDEGKGMVVSAICARPEVTRPLVIRFSGGHQAAHQAVYPDNRDHVFSNFGSGTFEGVPTYWSEYCTVDPVGIINELNILDAKGAEVRLLINKNCPVTTPYEKQRNREVGKACGHGSCGVGFGLTHQREEDFHSITISDLLHPTVLQIKLDLLQGYYKRIPSKGDMKEFMDCCIALKKAVEIEVVSGFPGGFDYHIFEGSQGLLLDQHHGFFPHVTRSNTGTKNILDIGYCPEVFLVTRAYQTRHGNGPMTNEGMNDHIKPNPHEQNFDDGFQGKFRTSTLDLDLLRYAISRDTYITTLNTNLVVTCLDLMKTFQLTVGGRLLKFDNQRDFILCIQKHLGFKEILLSDSPYPDLTPFKKGQ